MRAGLIHLAKHLISDGAAFVLKKYSVFGEHREVSEAIVLLRTIQCAALTRH